MEDPYAPHFWSAFAFSSLGSSGLTDAFTCSVSFESAPHSHTGPFPSQVLRQDHTGLKSNRNVSYNKVTHSPHAHMYISCINYMARIKYWRGGGNLADFFKIRQTDKLKPPPNFLAIRYIPIGIKQHRLSFLLCFQMTAPQVQTCLHLQRSPRQLTPLHQMMSVKTLKSLSHSSVSVCHFWLVEVRSTHKSNILLTTAMQCSKVDEMSEKMKGGLSSRSKNKLSPITTLSSDGVMLVGNTMKMVAAFKPAPFLHSLLNMSSQWF